MNTEIPPKNSTVTITLATGEEITGRVIFSRNGEFVLDTLPCYASDFEGEFPPPHWEYSFHHPEKDHCVQSWEMVKSSEEDEEIWSLLQDNFDFPNRPKWRAKGHVSEIRLHPLNSVVHLYELQRVQEIVSGQNIRVSVRPEGIFLVWD